MLYFNALHIFRFVKKIAILSLLFVNFSFYPEAGEEESDEGSGYYIVVQDYFTNTFHKYIVESKDSVDIIFNTVFESELQLGEIDRPITINNGKYDFYVARVVLYLKKNGQMSFKNLKYPPLEFDAEATSKRYKLGIINM